MNGFQHFSTDILCFKAEFVGYKINGFCVQALIDRHHLTYGDTSGNYVDNRHIHHGGQVVNGNKLGYFKHALFPHFFLFEFLHTLRCRLSFFSAVFCSFFRPAGQTGKCFFNLFGNILFADFSFKNGFLEAAFGPVAPGDRSAEFSIDLYLDILDATAPFLFGI